uniref:Uncharacterized protein n=1 Tax=Oryzias melastigma TaxID=30732 RepID=A0A3B3B585_ORYME
MNKMKNFKRRFSLSVPRTETIEENEFTEQINQLNISGSLWPVQHIFYVPTTIFLKCHFFVCS